MCECDSYQHNKWGDPETACRKCWNRYIEECGCGGLAEASPKLNEKTKYCCPEKCSVLSGEHIEGMKCLVCGIEGYCMCRCVMHRLSRYQPQEILEEYQVYEITEISRHFIEPPLFYNPTECPLKYRYRPFYFLKLKFTHSRKGVQGTVYIPPEITRIGFSTYPETQPTFENIIKNCKVFVYQGRRDYRFYPNLEAIMRENNAGVDEIDTLTQLELTRERDARQYLRVAIPQMETVIATRNLESEMEREDDDDEANNSFFGVD